MSSPVSPTAHAESVTAFRGFRRLATGTPAEVQAVVSDFPNDATVAVFDDATGERLDLPAATAPQPLAAAGKQRSVGRPKLGVVAREVTLLPRHWDWLSRQPGGASVALRRLVDDARRVHVGRDTVRAAREAGYRVMSALAGDLPGFEEAARALFAGDAAAFEARIADWPEDLPAHLRRIAANAWGAVDGD